MDSSIILSIFLGVGLSAAAGFRVFVPLLALSIANHFGIVPLGESFTWIGSFAAMIALAVATILEVGAYYIPLLDNLLDSVAIPLATIAGTGIVAATLVDANPMFTWGLAVIAGGGTAGAIKSATAGTRLMSSVKTVGLGNPIVSTVETGTSITMVFLAIFTPIIAIVFVVVVLYVLFKFVLKITRKSQEGNRNLSA